MFKIVLRKKPGNLAEKENDEKRKYELAQSHIKHISLDKSMYSTDERRWANGLQNPSSKLPRFKKYEAMYSKVH